MFWKLIKSAANAAKKISKPRYGGIYSCGGWNGGKLAFLLNVSVSFPYGNSNRGSNWGKDATRKGALSRALNLGCRKKYITPDCLNYNSEFTQDKLKVWEAFDREKVPHPRPLTESDILLKLKNGDAFLGRKNNSSRGRGIEKYTRKEWLEKHASDKTSARPQHDFYVEFLEFKAEFRVHVLFGEAVCELKKIVPEKSSGFIHTAEQGFPMEIAKIEHSKAKLIRTLSIKAVTACGLDLGAADVFVDTKDNVYILEVNSDPGMPGGVGYLYAQRLSIYEGFGGLKNCNVRKDGEVITYKNTKRK